MKPDPSRPCDLMLSACSPDQTGKSRSLVRVRQLKVLSACLPACLPACLLTCLPACLPMQLSVQPRLSVCLSVYPRRCLYKHTGRLSVILSICLHRRIGLPLRLPTWPSVQAHWSVCLPASLSVCRAACLGNNPPININTCISASQCA